MTSRDRYLLFALAGLAVALAALPLVGLHTDLLLAVPTLLFILPLIAGRYIGEERLAQLAAAFAPLRRRAARSLAATARRSPRTLPRGGHLIATSLAVRPPPAAPRLTA